jgi:transposase
MPACEPVRRDGPTRPIVQARPEISALGLMEAAIAASSHPLYRERYQRTKRRLGRQRGAKVAQIELARKLAEAIWYMLTRNQPFKPSLRQAPFSP